MKSFHFFGYVQLVFSSHVPEPAQEATLRRIMIQNRRLADFWYSKCSELGLGKKQKRNAPPRWTEENRFRAMELWLHLNFGPTAFAELRAAFRLGQELAPILESHRVRWLAVMARPPKKGVGRPRGVRNPRVAPVFEIGFYKLPLKKAA